MGGCFFQQRTRVRDCKLQQFCAIPSLEKVFHNYGFCVELEVYAIVAIGGNQKIGGVFFDYNLRLF